MQEIHHCAHTNAPIVLVCSNPTEDRPIICVYKREYSNFPRSPFCLADTEVWYEIILSLLDLYANLNVL